MHQYIHIQTSLSPLLDMFSHIEHYNWLNFFTVMTKIRQHYIRYNTQHHVLRRTDIRNYNYDYTLILTRQSEMADLARRATRWVGTLSDGNVHVKFHDDRLRNGGDITY